MDRRHRRVAADAIAAYEIASQRVSAPMTSARDARRVAIVVMVVVAIAAGIGAGRARSPRVERPPAPVDAAQLPVKGALSTAWYCPGLPADFPTANQTFTLSNGGASAADAVVTVYPDNGAKPVARTVRVPQSSVRTFPRSTLPDGPLVVEPFSSDVIVSAGLENRDRLSTVPCATTAATHWYFAAGTTVRGVSQWLVLDNPFAADARVDVTLRTEDGLSLLPSLSGLDVPGRSRIVVPIHNEAVRRARVSVEVHATVGRVVASQTLEFDATSGPTGVATSIGALAPSAAWWFADGDTRAGASEQVAIANVGELDARVNVQAQTNTKAIVRPVSLTVPSGGVSWVQVGGCTGSASDCLEVPKGTGFVLLVQSDANAPIVAETLSRFDGSNRSTTGAATSIGSAAPARGWVIPRTHAIGWRSTSIALADTALAAAHVSVVFVYDGTVVRPAILRRVTIASGARFVIPLGTVSALRRQDAMVFVTSDVPILAESTIYSRHDATRAPGIAAR